MTRAQLRREVAEVLRDSLTGSESVLVQERVMRVFERFLAEGLARIQEAADRMPGTGE